MKLLLLVVASIVTANAQSIVQSTNCSTAGTTLTCPLSSNPTVGNFYAIYIGGSPLTANNGCLNGFSNSLSFTFTRLVYAQNPVGAESFNCISMANITSTGSDTVTYTKAFSGFAFMWVFEVTGIARPALASANAVFNRSGNTVTVDPVSTPGVNSMLLCIGADDAAGSWTSATPAGGTAFLSDTFVAAPLYQFVGIGTYQCSFTKSAMNRFSGSAAILYQPSIARFRGGIIQ